MRTRVKICCLSSYEEAQYAIALGADAVGFVGIDPPSPRALPDAEIAAIIWRIPPPLATVVLSASDSSEQIAKQVQATGASTVQLLAPAMTPVETERLRESLPSLRLVKVIHVEDDSVFGLIDQHSPYIHAFLLDSGRPSLAIPEYGGTGRVHDWSISAEFVRRSPLPVFLAGGLTEHYVQEAITTVRPFGVDLCSGVRTDGHLDHKKLSNFIETVRRTDRELNDL